MGAQESSMTRENIDLLAKNLFKIEWDEGDRLKPICYIEWVIVTLLGKTIGYYTMRENLRAAWSLTSAMEMVDIENGIFKV